MTGADGKIRINRAPVLTLWAAVVAERLGVDRATALTLGQAVAGLSAYDKGVSLGIVEPRPELVQERGERLQVGLPGRGTGGVDLEQAAGSEQWGIGEAPPRDPYPLTVASPRPFLDPKEHRRGIEGYAPAPRPDGIRRLVAEQ